MKNDYEDRRAAGIWRAGSGEYGCPGFWYTEEYAGNCLRTFSIEGEGGFVLGRAKCE